jgi:epoxyqueuosine reductase
MSDALDPIQLRSDIGRWAAELGFRDIGVTGVSLKDDERHLDDWLAQGQHGEMDYMARHGSKRARPDELVPGTLRVISLRMDYATGDDADAWQTIADGERAYVARYALGRDYHKLMRNRLQKLASRIEAAIGPFGYRAFVDSAPVLERALARNAGLGWIGKHTCLIDKRSGSWFFLGELFTDLPLPTDPPASEHCGTCRRCIDICPTQAIVATLHDEPDFRARNDLDRATLAELFAWTEEEFLRRTEGSAIRRTGYQGWLRNIAVALGNAPGTDAVLAALRTRVDDDSELVREHVRWALARHRV